MDLSAHHRRLLSSLTPEQRTELFACGATAKAAAANVYGILRRATEYHDEPFATRLRAALEPVQYRGLTSFDGLCTACGRCCRLVTKTKSLFSGRLDADGNCLDLKPDGKCACYRDRPLSCRVDDMYDLVIEDQMPRAEYYALQRAVCVLLERAEATGQVDADE